MAISPIEKTGPRQIYKVDPVRLYAATNEHVNVTAQDNPFKGTVGWGLFNWNFSDPGQINGGTKPEYFEDGSCREPRTICWA